MTIYVRVLAISIYGRVLLEIGLGICRAEENNGCKNSAKDYYSLHPEQLFSEYLILSCGLLCYGPSLQMRLE